MKSELKTEKVEIRSLGRKLQICELSAKAQIEIMEAIHMEQGLKSHFIACKYGVPEWNDETVDDLSINLPLRACTEIAEAIYKLSGIDAAKNSESVPSEDSSTDSRPN
jgi:hypothetical protein